jgi:hypothetical protein
MKQILALWVALSSPVLVHAQGTDRVEVPYLEFRASIALSHGESMPLTLKVHPDLRVDRYGDPEIPFHGFHDYVVTGSLAENGVTCNFEALLTQADGQAVSTSQILEMNVDRPYGIKTCSGRILGITSLRALLVGESTRAQLNANGVDRLLGTGSVTFVGRKSCGRNGSQ